MTRDKLLSYVSTLTPELQSLFKSAEDAMVMTQHDTLADDFQISAKVLEVFYQYALRRSTTRSTDASFH